MKKDYTPLKEPEPPENYENIQLPEDAFENLYAAKETGDSALYHIWQGGLYENIRKSVHVSDVDASQVSRKLNKGKIEEAEKLTEELLEPEKQQETKK